MPVDDLGDYDVQPVEGNPFGAMASSPNDYDVAPVDHDPFAGGFGALDRMTGRADRAATPDPAPAPEAPQPYPVSGGQLGQEAEGAYQTVAGGIGSAINWLGDRGEQAVGAGAATLGMPAPAGFARDIRAMVESGEGLGPHGEPAPTRKLNDSGFYSHGADMAAQLPQAKGNVGQYIAALTKQGVKPEEIARSGLGDMAANAPATRDGLVNLFETNRPQIQETQLDKLHYGDVEARAQQLHADEGFHDWGSEEDDVRNHFLDLAEQERWHGGGGAKYDAYTLPGGTNYRELLLHTPDTSLSQQLRDEAARRGYGDRISRWPDQEFAEEYRRNVTNAPDQEGAFTSSHWDTPNVLAHLRMSDRAGPNGEKLLHLEELQSDWGQKGRDQGFRNPDDAQRWQELIAKPSEQRTPDEQSWIDNYARSTASVQPGPFVGSTAGWTDLGLKRVLTEAARGGYDGLVWTPGEDQAARYDLSKHIDTLHWSGGNLTAYDPNGYRVHQQTGMTAADLPGVIGHELTEKLLAQEPVQGWRTLTGADLKTGGEGMKSYYDNILPNRLKNLTKKLDPSAMIGKTTIATDNPGYDVYGVHSGGSYGTFATHDRAWDELERVAQAHNIPTEHLGVRRNVSSEDKELPHLPLTPLMRERIMKGMPQYARGGGVVSQNAEVRRKIALISRPRHGFADGGAPDDPNAAGFSALDKMTGRASAPDAPAPAPEPAQVTAAAVDPETGLPSFDPATNVPREPQTPVSGGRWGKAAELGYEDVSGAIGSALDWAGNKAERYTGSTLAAAGVPGATGLARDLRAMVESGEGTSGLHPPEVAPTRYNHPSFPEGRIATRVPTSAALGPTAHLTNEAKIGLDTMQDTPPFLAKTAVKARQMPYEPGPPTADGKPTWRPTETLNIPADATDEQVHEHLVNHFTSNILALHDAVDPDIVPGSQQWYDGAHARSNQQAQLYDKPVENIAGTYAAMSPKMDWFQNVALSDRIMHILHNFSDTPFTPEMNDWVAKRYGNARAPADVRAQARFARISGSTINQLDDPLDKAHWVRAYDEAHNSRDYNIVNPDGTFARTATNDDGSNAKVAWGNGYEPIAKAITAFNAQDMPTISQAMGEAHKVRSFYNNIISPYSEHGDVTVDTHAIAAALLRPLSGDARDVDIGLGSGGPDHNATGMHGLYGAYVEAYRKAAEARGILPRQMQSVTWEALRGLWSPEEKASAAVNASVRNTWARFKNGEIDLPTAQRELLTHPETGASRIRPPDWHTAGWRP